MSQNDDFLGGMKSEKDKIKEWADAAQYYVDIRRTGEPEAVEPLPEEPEKTAASLKGLAQGALGAAKRFDPTGVAKAMGTKDGRIAALAGGALFGLGTALQSRGRKEYGGQSKLEHSLGEMKAENAARKEPPSFTGKMKNHLVDLSAGVASTARKHPIKAGFLGALGGAAAGTRILSQLTKKAI